MTEDEVRQALRDDYGASAKAMDRLTAFVDLLKREARRQNLVARSTLDQVWHRHILDSAQLVPLASRAEEGIWLDLGSGAGFPGLVTCLLSGRQTVLIESRKLRCEFLRSAAAVLEIESGISIVEESVQTAQLLKATAISARAFASLDRIPPLAYRFSTEKTVWLMPKGENYKNELEATTRAWQGSFHVEHSVTNSASAIIVAHGVRPR